MKRILLVVCFVMGAMAFTAPPAQSFNPAAHVYIADKVCPTCTDKINLYYGSIAPDLSQYTDPVKWKSGDPFYATHYTYANLMVYATGASQKAFAAGWFTHNEADGADHFAHGTPGNNYADGYVTQQGLVLSGILGLTPDFAHFAIEAAIDLLLKEKDRSLGTKLLTANLLRSPLDREVLTKALVLQHRETDWLTLVAAELTFRNAINQYATALALPKPFDKEAVIKLGVQLAQQEFGIPATPEQLRAVLDAAIELCRPTYYELAVQPAIKSITCPTSR